MKGIELSEKFYNAFGAPVLSEKFPDIMDKIAIGVCGSGSDCFGYDDEISTDHDFEPGFCIFLPGEDIVDRRTAFLLEREYAKLPKDFMGYKRERLSPVGGNRRGVFRTSDFLKAKTGTEDGKLNLEVWISIPENYLLEATNGKIFLDNYGEFTEIRNRLSFFPKDVMVKKLAGYLLLSAQSGPYNFSRCLKHNEPCAAQLALTEFVTSVMHIAFLLNGKYMPYYKWCFRAYRELSFQPASEQDLEFLLTSPNNDIISSEKKSIIEKLSDNIYSELLNNGLISPSSKELEAMAYEVNNKIDDNILRNRDVLWGV